MLRYTYPLMVAIASILLPLAAAMGAVTNP